MAQPLKTHTHETSIKDGEVSFQKVTDLPVGMSYVCAATLGADVYVFSGQSADGASSQAWVMNTSSTDRSQWVWGWKSIPWPEFSDGQPARARTFFTMGSRNGYGYKILFQR